MSQEYKKSDWIVVASIAVVIVLVMLFAVLVALKNEDFWDAVVSGGYIPRVLSWSFMLIGIYGMARRRFSPLLTMGFFFISFFFAYIGYFIMPGIY